MGNTLHKLLALLLALCLAFPHPGRAQDSFFQIGSGDIKGIYFPLTKRLCRLVNDNVRVHDQRCGIAATAGSQENLNGLRDGRHAFALLQSNSLLAELDGGETVDFRTVAALHSEPIHIVVRAESSVDDIADLAGLTVNIGGAASGTAKLAQDLLSAAGIANGAVQTQQFGPEQQAQRLCQGDVDALIFVSGIRNSSMTEAHRRCDVRMLSVSPETSATMAGSVAGLVPIIIPAGTYPGQSNDITSIGPIARLVTKESTPTETVSIVVQALKGDFGNFANVHPALEAFDSSRLQPLFAGEFYHPGVIGRPRFRPSRE